MRLELKDKVVLITGSSSGIGLGIAKGFVEEEARVILTGRNEEVLRAAADSLGPQAYPFRCDLTDPQEVGELTDYIVGNFSSLDCLVCNLGSGKSVPPGKETSDEWERVFSVNYFSTVKVIEAMRDLLVRSRSVITCISSICGVEALGAPVTYSAAKSALNAYINNISRFFGPLGVRINSVSPGNIMFEGSVWERKLRDNEPEVMNMIRREVPLNCFGSPEDIANTVLFLSSPRASFLTGANIVLDGGQTRSL